MGSKSKILKQMKTLIRRTMLRHSLVIHKKIIAKILIKRKAVKMLIITKVNNPHFKNNFKQI